MRTLRIVLLGGWTVLAGCADVGATGSARPGWAPVGGISQVTIDGATYHYADLLGEPRAWIERGLASGSSEARGWIGYGDDLDILYDDRGVAVKLKARVPMGIEGCSDIARWIGFSNPRKPSVRGGRCSWTGVQVAGRLEKGYGGEFDASSRWFRIWLVDPTPPVA